jgi:hypothetical protein
MEKGSIHVMEIQEGSVGREDREVGLHFKKTRSVVVLSIIYTTKEERMSGVSVGV